MIWRLATAPSFQPWYLSISYWMSHITTQSPELESPQPSRSSPSARFIKPHAESALHAIFISTVSEEMWITATQPTALPEMTLKIIMKVVNPMREPPKRGALGRLVQGSAVQAWGGVGITCLHLWAGGRGWLHPEAAGEVPPHWGDAGGKGLTDHPAGEQPTLVSLFTWPEVQLPQAPCERCCFISQTTPGHLGHGQPELVTEALLNEGHWGCHTKCFTE